MGAVSMLDGHSCVSYNVLDAISQLDSVCVCVCAMTIVTFYIITYDDIMHIIVQQLIL